MNEDLQLLMKEAQLKLADENQNYMNQPLSPSLPLPFSLSLPIY